MGSIDHLNSLELGLQVLLPASRSTDHSSNNRTKGPVQLFWKQQQSSGCLFGQPLSGSAVNNNFHVKLLGSALYNFYSFHHA